MREPGPGDGAGARLAEGLGRRGTRANVIAHATGALVTFFAVGFLAPLSVSNHDLYAGTLRNAIAVPLYVAVVLVVFVRVGNRRARPILSWLRSEQPAGDEQRALVL